MRALGVGLAILALGACSDRKTATSAAPPAAILPAAKPPKSQPLVPYKTTTLVTAIVGRWDSTKATMQLWHRAPGATNDKYLGGWIADGAPWPAVIGASGAAWGIGLHGNGAPNREGPIKKEGDRRSPAGAFALRAVYGLADDSPGGGQLPYETTKLGDWECIDDPGSEYYGQIVERRAIPADWTSSEQLLRDDALYTWIVDVAHNPDHVRGKGSCIFLHVWGGKDSTTVGCTAMEDSKLQTLIAELHPTDEPVFVLLPLEDYQALAPAWGLPSPSLVAPPPP